MQEILIRKLHDYIGDNNPDVLIKLQAEGKVTEYLNEKVASVDPLLNELLIKDTQPYFIEVYCLHMMTADLRPSKFNYTAEILETEFPSVYRQLSQVGVLRYELINMIEVCQPVFDSFEFSETNEQNRMLRYAVTGVIHDYFENKKWN